MVVKGVVKEASYFLSSETHFKVRVFCTLWPWCWRVCDLRGLNQKVQELTSAHSLSIGKSMISQYTILGSYRVFGIWILAFCLTSPKLVQSQLKDQILKRRKKKNGTTLEENTLNIYIIAKWEKTLYTLNYNRNYKRDLHLTEEKKNEVQGN